MERTEVKQVEPGKEPWEETFTLRIGRDLHHALREEAYKRRTSANQLCAAILRNALEAELRHVRQQRMDKAAGDLV